MTVVAARAYSFSGTFRPRDLGRIFASAGAEVTVAKDEITARFPDGGIAIGFDFGAVTFFGCEAARDGIVAAITKQLSDGEPHAPLTEEIPIDVQPGRPVEVRFDRVMVPELTRSVIGVVGLLLAQSAAMDYYDEDVAEILARTGAITRDLATRGRLRGRVVHLVRFIGTCIHTRNGVIETLALFDKPDVTWEEEAIDKLFIRLREVLEIDDRFRAFEYKLRMIQDNLVLLVDLSRQRHTFWLETTVLLLILLEVIVMVWQVVRGRG